MRRPSRLLACALLPALAAACSGPDRSPPASPARVWVGGPAFPIAVWLQDPARHFEGRTNAENYRDIGINTLVGLWNWPPTDAQVAAVERAGLHLIAGGGDGDVGAATGAADPGGYGRVLDGYVLIDEPDLNLREDHGGCVPPDKVTAMARTLKAADPVRLVYLNGGKGFAIPGFTHGANCPRPSQQSAYAHWLAEVDIASVSYYALSDPYQPVSDKGIWAYGRSVDRMREFVGDAKPVWSFIETTLITRGSTAKATPGQVRSMVWMSIIHGARGIEYFAHSFNCGTPDAPVDCSVEDSLLRDPAMAGGVAAVNAEITALADVLAGPTVTGAVTVSSSNRSVPVDTLVKRDAASTYVFAIGSGTAGDPDGGRTTARFTVAGAGSGTVEVIGEGRTLPMTGGRFSDAFDPYAVHLYRIGPS